MGCPPREDIESAHAEPGPDGLTLRVGSWAFSYDRAGIIGGT